MEKVTMTPEDYGELARALRRVDFFAALTIGQLEKILPYIMLYRGVKGTTVFSQGDVGDALYILRAGRVSVRVRKGFLFSKSVAELKAGDFFGEMALLAKDKRTATIRCEEESRFFVLLAADFQSVLRQNPGFADEMKKNAERRRFMSSHEE